MGVTCWGQLGDKGWASLPACGLVRPRASCSPSGAELPLLRGGDHTALSQAVVVSTSVTVP